MSREPEHEKYPSTEESSKKKLESESKETREENEYEYDTDPELTEEMKEEILKGKGFRTWKEYKNSRKVVMAILLAAMQKAPKITMSAEEYHRRMGI